MPFFSTAQNKSFSLRFETTATFNPSIVIANINTNILGGHSQVCQSNQAIKDAYYNIEQQLTCFGGKITIVVTGQLNNAPINKTFSLLENLKDFLKQEGLMSNTSNDENRHAYTMLST